MKEKLKGIQKYLYVVIVMLFTAAPAVRVYAQNRQITYKSNNTSLYDIFREIKKQSGLTVFYNNDVIKNKQAIKVDFTNADLKTVLNTILKDEDVRWEIKGKFIVLQKDISKREEKPAEIAKANQQVGKVEGTVKDNTGKALEGVNVSVKEGNQVTATKSDGSYIINVGRRNATLVFTHTGYAALEVKINGRTKVDVTMEVTASDMDEVVIIGYGEMRKKDLTGSVSSIRPDDAEQRPLSSLEQLIQGKVSGVQISQNSGAPGGGINFIVRGVNSFGNSQPLIILDGYPIETESDAVNSTAGSESWTSSIPGSNPLATLNPDDIESIEILKDASSTAIYGSRGANGVVIITTKSGKAGEDKISYNYRMDINNIPKQIPMLSTADFITYANEANLNSGLDSVYKAQQIAGFGDRNINWQDLIYRTGHWQDHNISLGGKDAKNTYSIAANYASMNGVVEKSKYQRGGLRLNYTRKVSNRFNVGVNFNATMSLNSSVAQASKNGGLGVALVSGALRFKPVDVPYDEDGDVNETLANNPLTVIKNVDDDTRIRTTLVNLFGEYTIAKGLIFKVNGGINDIATLRQTYFGPGTYQGNTYGGMAFKGDNSSFNYLAEYTLRYNKQIKRHNISAVGGYTWQKWYRRSSGVRTSQFNNGNLGYDGLAYGSIVSLPGLTHLEWALASYLARVNYVFDNRYLLTLTGRSDGSSRLAENHKWDFFPSIAAGWNIHNEKFFNTNGTVSELKLRASFGISGNQVVDVGATQALLQMSRSVVGTSIVNGVVLSSFSNPDLHWERTNQYNIGADIGLFKNRLNINLEWYQKLTNDLLINYTIPSHNGFTSYTYNIGKVENKGLEFELDAKILNKALKWNFNGNISFNRNKIIDLGGAGIINGENLLPAFISQNISVALPGHPIGVFYGYKVNGIYQSADEVTNGPEDPVNPAPGDFKYVDINGDNKITAEDKTIIGDPNPDYIFGITNNFNYKGFGLSFFIQGVIGQDIFNLNRFFSDALVYNQSTANSNVRAEAFEGRWTGPGTSNYYPRAKSTGSAFDDRFTSFLVEDGSYVRLKNITLSYDLSNLFLKIKNIKLFVTGTNLFTITGYKGYDPEVSITNNSGINRNVDFGIIPNLKTYSFGVNVQF